MLVSVTKVEESGMSGGWKLLICVDTGDCYFSAVVRNAHLIFGKHYQALIDGDPRSAYSNEDVRHAAETDRLVFTGMQFTVAIPRALIASELAAAVGLLLSDSDKKPAPSGHSGARSTRTGSSLP